MGFSADLTSVSWRCLDGHEQDRQRDLDAGARSRQPGVLLRCCLRVGDLLLCIFSLAFLESRCRLPAGCVQVSLRSCVVWSFHSWLMRSHCHAKLVLLMVCLLLRFSCMRSNTSCFAATRATFSPSGNRVSQSMPAGFVTQCGFCVCHLARELCLLHFAAAGVLDRCFLCALFRSHPCCLLWLLLQRTAPRRPFASRPTSTRFAFRVRILRYLALCLRFLAACSVVFSRCLPVCPIAGVLCLSS